MLVLACVVVPSLNTDEVRLPRDQASFRHITLEDVVKHPVLILLRFEDLRLRKGHCVGIPPEEPLEKQSYRSNRQRTGFWKRTGAIATSFITVTGMMLGSAVPANAAPEDDSEALGKFLGGQALGIDLDDIAEVHGALAENPSGEYPLVTNPLGAEVLNALNIDLGDGIQLLGENGVIQLGAVNQYAEAQNNGDAYAASGAVSDQGAIGVGASSDYPSDAQINLAALLPDGSEGIITDLSLELGALSSSIEQSDGESVTDYEIAGATLNLASPAVGGIYTDLLETVDGLQGTLDGLSGTISDGLSLGLDLGGLANLSTDVDFVPPNLSELLPDEVVGESSGVDRKSTRLNSSHVAISYAVFCL